MRPIKGSWRTPCPRAGSAHDTAAVRSAVRGRFVRPPSPTERLLVGDVGRRGLAVSTVRSGAVHGWLLARVVPDVRLARDDHLAGVYDDGDLLQGRAVAVVGVDADELVARVGRLD